MVKFTKLQTNKKLILLCVHSKYFLNVKMRSELKEKSLFSNNSFLKLLGTVNKADILPKGVDGLPWPRVGC